MIMKTEHTKCSLSSQSCTWTFGWKTNDSEENGSDRQIFFGWFAYATTTSVGKVFSAYIMSQGYCDNTDVDISEPYDTKQNVWRVFIRNWYAYQNDSVSQERLRLLNIW